MNILLLIVLYASRVCGSARRRARTRTADPGAWLAFLALLPVPRASSRRSSRTARSCPRITGSPSRRGPFRARPPPRNPNLDDAITQFAPWESAARAAWRAGELPLRDRWNGSGTPLAANATSAAFSPLHLLASALPLARAFTLIAAVNVLLAAVGMWLWARELGVSPQASLVAAPAWALSLAMTPWLLFPQTGVLSLWPWLLFLAERARETVFATRCAAALTVVFAVMVLAGHPESLALGCVFCAGWLLLRAALGRDRRCLTALARVAACGAVAALLVAWLLLPTLAALAASNRLAGLSALPWARFLSLAPHAPAWPAGPLQLLFPFTLRRAASPRRCCRDRRARFPRSRPATPASPRPFSRSWCSDAGPRRRESVALLLLAAAGVLVAVGQWPFLEAASRIPLIRFMVPLRFLTWAALAVPVLAALELDRYARDAAAGGRPWRGLAVAGLGVAAAAAATFAFHRAAHAQAGGLAFQLRALAAACAVALGLAAAGLLLRRRTAALCAAAAALVAVELLVDARHLYRAAPSAGLFPETPLVAFLRSRTGVFRTAGAGPALFPNTNVFARTQDVRTHDPLERREYLEFLDESCGYPPDEYFRMLRRLDCGALDFLNARYLVAPAGRVGAGGEVDARVRRVRRNRLRERRGAPARLRSAPRPLRAGGRRPSRRAKSRLERRGRPDRGGSARAGRRTRACEWTATTSPSIA